MLRPSVLKQLNPDVVRLVNEFPEVDEPNKEVVARLLRTAGWVTPNRCTTERCMVVALELFRA
jgi:hypothetical protein